MNSKLMARFAGLPVQGKEALPALRKAITRAVRIRVDLAERYSVQHVC
ncbi:MAG: hypothetical protein K8F27_11585 [Sulfuricellaceae bacterium]|nr:hypothetical protein [Sulfuricellaceae bacterium]